MQATGRHLQTKNTMQTNPISRRSLLFAGLALTVSGAALAMGCAVPSAAEQTNAAGQITNGKTKKMMNTEPTPVKVPEGKQIATLGAGCFWCVEAIFQDLKGVEKVTSGYSGGGVDNPSYEQVCTGTTGHAEAVQILFDPKVIAFRDILHIFFTVHDPTTLNRQGADHGTQYRSAIFFHDAEQKKVAEEVIKEVNAEKVYSDPIVTEVTPFSNFYSAEGYHQNYYKANSNQGYCRMVIAPKVLKFRAKYSKLLKN